MDGNGHGRNCFPGLKKARSNDWALALLLSLYVLPVAVIQQPRDKMAQFEAMLQSPLKFLLVWMFCLLLAYYVAAITEEIFFRGLLQERLGRLLGSEWAALIASVFLFAVYHMSSAFTKQGNIAGAFFSVMEEQAVGGLLLGLIWMRTRNLWICMFIHALIDSVALLAQLKIR